MKNPLSIDESIYKPDFEILDRYIQFSSELLRISLVAMARYGTLIITYIKNIKDLQTITISMLFFALCSATTLFHRFFASDSMSWYISSIRKSQKGDIEGYKEEKSGMMRLLKYSRISLIISEILFGIAVIIFIIGLFQFIYK